MAPITAVVAVARNGVIGAGDTIPWRIPGEQARFKRITMGGVLVMGRKTFESIGRPLPGRETIVVTRDPDWSHEGVTTASSVPLALTDALSLERPVFVVGGGEIYRLAMPFVDVIEYSRVEAEPDGDATFPELDPDLWRETAQEPGEGVTFLRYERSREPLRVAVIGAGPAGLYLADALLGREDLHARIDLYDELPTPFGLLRYGVAPDHLKMKSLQETLQRVVHDPRVRFIGGVRLGEQLSVRLLRNHYHAVAYAFGSATDRHLNVPGEELSGSHSATEFVKWYSGHPDTPPTAFDLQQRSAVVVGLGNVAVDVARVLLKDPEALSSTDIPQPVLDVLADSQIRDVHILGRRGPVQAKFTPKELAELGNLEGVDVFLASQDLVLDPASEAELASAPKAIATNLAVLSGWADRVPTGAPRRLFLHFWTRPVLLRGEGHVNAVVVQRSRVLPDGSTTDTGVPSPVPAGLVLRSVGYLGVRIPDVPFDDATGTVPNLVGQVLRDGQPAQGEFVTGWARRGPTGVLGTNRKDAGEVAEQIAGQRDRLLDGKLDQTDPVANLTAGGVAVVDVRGWDLIDLAEQQLGASRGRNRTKLATTQELLDAANLQTE